MISPIQPIKNIRKIVKAHPLNTAVQKNKYSVTAEFCLVS